VRFWDSSAVVPLLVFEDASEAMEAILGDDGSMAAWWGTPVECMSAVGRRERDNSIDPAEAARAEDKLIRLATRWVEVEPVEPVRNVARRLVRVHDLRAGDALQLAAAARLSETRHEPLPIVTRDTRLALAASREGLPVLTG